MMVWAQSAGGRGRDCWTEPEVLYESGSGLGVLEWEWSSRAGGVRRAEFAGGGWECRSGSGLVVLEVL